MHLAKYPGSICGDMCKITCLGDRTRYKINFLVINTWLCNPDLYLENAKDLKEIGWELMMQYEVMFFMGGVCFWSNLRLFMHGWKHHLPTSFFWYLKNYPSESGRVFFLQEVWFARTIWAFFRQIWVRFGYGMLRIQHIDRCLTIWAIEIIQSPQILTSWII